MAGPPVGRWRRYRDAFLFGFGTAGLTYEVVWDPTPSVEAMLIFGGFMAGVPFLRVGDREHDQRGPEGSGESE